jgi:predicted transcriptional regulator
MAEQNSTELNIELSEEVADGIYSNLAIIAHSHSEFVIDFVRILPNLPKAKVKARIILTPEHAKRLMQALGENLQKFEAQHGKIIPNNSGNVPPFPIGFNSHFGQA